MAAKKKEIVDTEVINGKAVDVELTPTAYFEDVKGRMNNITSEKIKGIYENALKIAKTFIITKQAKAAKKLVLYLDSIEKEMKVIDAGFTKYVLRQDVELYMDKVAKQVVKIVSLGEYERIIPDDVIEKISNIPDGLFDEMYVIFTDYTGKEEKKVAKEKRDKDPILFGAILRDGYVTERMYFIADWVDEYCDLTLDKMVEEFKNADEKVKNKAANKDMVAELKLPETVEELKKVINDMKY